MRSRVGVRRRSAWKCKPTRFQGWLGGVECSLLMLIPQTSKILALWVVFVPCSSRTHTVRRTTHSKHSAQHLAKSRSKPETNRNRTTLHANAYQKYARLVKNDRTNPSPNTTSNHPDIQSQLQTKRILLILVDVLGYVKLRSWSFGFSFSVHARVSRVFNQIQTHLNFLSRKSRIFVLL